MTYISKKTYDFYYDWWLINFCDVMVRTYVYYKKNDLSEIPATKEIKVKKKIIELKLEQLNINFLAQRTQEIFNIEIL